MTFTSREWWEHGRRQNLKIKTISVNHMKQWLLKEELARINKQRIKTEKENNTLRREITLWNKLYNQIKENTTCEGEKILSTNAYVVKFLNLIKCHHRKMNFILTKVENHWKKVVTIIMGIKVIDRTIPLPKFDGIKRNPIEFIKELEKYF